MNKRVFPEGFLWGVATAAHQVEGDNYNDFSEWEKMGRCKDISGSACNHWDLEQFKKDIDLLQKLGSNAYRMSIEWSRIMPRIDVINHSVIEHYRKMLSILKSAAMSPMVTLHHFTNPVWFGNIGGWDCGSLNPFYKYVDEATNALADQVDYWCTINEPLIFIACAYIAGIRPPGEKGRLAKAFRLRKKFAKAHNEAYRIVKTHTNRPVGIVNQFVSFETQHGWAHERAIAGVLHKIVNSWIIEHTTNDFIGVNYYLRLLFDALRPWRIWGPGPRNDIGWEINAPSLTKLLLELKGYNIPLIITENGIADATDSLRGEFIRRHIEALTEAMKSGVNCLGYYHWTPFDNFEWDQGFGARFGLIKVDFETQERTVRPSAYVYRDIIRT